MFEGAADEQIFPGAPESGILSELAGYDDVHDPACLE